MPDLVGLPVSIQIVTAKWQDELCMKLMKDVEMASEWKHRTNLAE